jgi:hypothetical protein
VTRYTDAKFLVPPREEESVYPYRRVWRSLIIETGSLFAITVAFFVLFGMLGIRIPRGLWQGVNVGLALLPALLWFVFSWMREKAAPQPRQQLLSIVIITGLTTNAISIPLINWLSPDNWLALEGLFSRIFGYTFSIGIVQVGTLYFVVRFLTWPHAYRIRNDAIAYCLSAAVGYITVWNLHYVSTEGIAPDIAALRIFSTTTLIILAAMLLAYGFAELRFTPKIFPILSIMILFAAVLIGFGISFRSGLVGGGFTLGIGGTRPLFGLGFSAGLLFAGLMGILFLFNVAERSDRDAKEGNKD